MSDQITPFFEVARAAGELAGVRRLLVITYHFPPSQTAGALRWQKLARYAAERGWICDFITLHPSQIAKPDVRRLEELPPGTRVFGVRHREHWTVPSARAASKTVKAVKAVAARTRARAASAEATPVGAGHPAVEREQLRWIPRGLGDVLRIYRAWRYHADEDVWVRQAKRVAHRLAQKEAYDMVVSCGPPHLVHEAARDVARAHTLPFVMDLRDPWSLLPDLNSDYASPLWFAVAEHFERKTLAAASLVVMNTQPARDAMREKYPAASDRIIAVLNGFDEDPLPASRHASRFTIAYAGSIYMNRDPRLTFRAAAKLIAERRLTPQQFGFQFLGDANTYGGPPVSQIAAEEGIGEYVEVFPPRPRAAAMEFLANATLLLNLPQASRLCVPSKVYEYMRFDAWILALEPRDTATELVLRGTGADVVTPEDVDAILRVLQMRYDAYARGERPRAVAAHSHFSRRDQAALLLDAFERVVRR